MWWCVPPPRRCRTVCRPRGPAPPTPPRLGCSWLPSAAADARSPRTCGQRHKVIQPTVSRREKEEPGRQSQGLRTPRSTRPTGSSPPTAPSSAPPQPPPPLASPRHGSDPHSSAARRSWALSTQPIADQMVRALGSGQPSGCSSVRVTGSPRALGPGAAAAAWARCAGQLAGLPLPVHTRTVARIHQCSQTIIPAEREQQVGTYACLFWMSLYISSASTSCCQLDAVRCARSLHRRGLVTEPEPEPEPEPTWARAFDGCIRKRVLLVSTTIAVSCDWCRGDRPTPKESQTQQE